jgi:EmrB/QacA subfamily drug resistance transporter
LCYVDETEHALRSSFVLSQTRPTRCIGCTNQHQSPPVFRHPDTGRHAERRRSRAAVGVIAHSDPTDPKEHMTRSLERSSYKTTFAVLVVAAVSYALLQSMVTPVLHTIQVDLHTSQSTVTWVLTAYLLSASVFTPILGRVGDMIGKERMLVITLVILAAGTALAGVAHNIDVLILARAIQGVGGAVLPLSFGIIRDDFPTDKVAGGVGIIAAMIAVGAGAGLVQARPIVKALNYHWLFWLPLITTIIAAIAAHFFVPESEQRTPGKISWLAAVLLSGWLVALLVGVSEAPLWGWGSSKVIGLIALSVVIAAAWVRVELRSREPLIDMKMMRVPAVWTNNLVALLFGVGMYSVMAFLPEFVQTPRSAGYGFGASIIQSGLYLVPLTVFMFIFGMLSGRLAASIGSKAAVIIGAVFSAGAYFILAFAHSSSWEIYTASAMIGVGLGLAFSAMSNLIVQAVPPAQTGVASGMNANIRTIGGALGAAVMSTIVTSGLQADGYPKSTSYAIGFAFLGGVTVFAVIASLLIPTAVAEEADHDHAHHLLNAELALVAGGTIAEE